MDFMVNGDQWRHASSEGKEMTKYIVFVIALLFFCITPTSAYGQSCKAEAMSEQPYKGLVGVITKVTKVAEGDESMRVTYSYEFPNGQIGTTWSILSVRMYPPLVEGAAFAWLPVSAKYARDDGKGQRYMPIAFLGEKCLPIGLDWATKESDIPL